MPATLSRTVWMPSYSIYYYISRILGLVFGARGQGSRDRVVQAGENDMHGML